MVFWVGISVKWQKMNGRYSERYFLIMLKLLMDTLKIREARLAPCSQKDVVMAAPRPPDVSLDSSRAFALGFKSLPLSEELNGLCGIV